MKIFLIILCLTLFFAATVQGIAYLSLEKQKPADEWYVHPTYDMMPMGDDGYDRTGQRWQWVTNKKGEWLYRYVGDYKYHWD